MLQNFQKENQTKTQRLQGVTEKGALGSEVVSISTGWPPGAHVSCSLWRWGRLLQFHITALYHQEGPHWGTGGGWQLIVGTQPPTCGGCPWGSSGEEWGWWRQVGLWWQGRGKA